MYRETPKKLQLCLFGMSPVLVSAVCAWPVEECRGGFCARDWSVSPFRRCVVNVPKLKYNDNLWHASMLSDNKLGEYSVKVLSISDRVLV